MYVHFFTEDYCLDVVTAMNNSLVTNSSCKIVLSRNFLHTIIIGQQKVHYYSEDIDTLTLYNIITQSNKIYNHDNTNLV